MKNLKALTASLAVMLGSGLLLSTGIALADDVSNTLDGSVDASLETVSLVKNGASAVVNYSVAARDGDGLDGCNLSASSSLIVNVQSGNPAVATVSPASLTFTNCTDVKTVSVTPVGAGQAEITLAQSANGSAGFFNLSGAAFVAVVADIPPPDTTPPVIVARRLPRANAAGWNTSDVTLSWSVTDPESPILSKSGCDTSVQTAETSGVAFTCSATSTGGTNRKSVTIMLDETAPTVTIASPLNGAEYKLNEEVKADWSASDGRSGIATARGTKASGALIDTLTAGEHTFTVQATDRAGNQTKVTVKYTVKPKEGEAAGLKKVTICHRGRLSLTLAGSALKAHLKHGDTVGTCRR